MRNKFGAAIGGQTLLDEGPEGSSDFVRVLRSDEPEREFGARLRRQHGLRSFARIASKDSVDITSGTRPNHFENIPALFASRNRKPDTAQKVASAQTQGAPLLGDLLRKLCHAIIKTRQGDAAFFIVQTGDDAREHMDR